MPTKYKQKRKEKLRKEARERYQNLSEEKNKTKKNNTCQKFLKSKKKKSINIIVNK